MRRLIVSLVLLAGLIGVMTPLSAAAMPQPMKQMAVCDQTVAAFFGLEPWHSCLQKKYGEVKIGAYSDIWLIVLPIFDDVLKMLGYVAAGFVIWGGTKYIKSNGEPSEIGQAKDVIRNALIGLVVCLLSVAIVEFVAGGYVLLS